MATFKFERMKEAYHSGGYSCTLSDEALKRQKGVIWDIVKQLGFKAFSSIPVPGSKSKEDKDKDLISVSLPVRIFEPRSYLQRIVDGWWSAPIYLKLAADSTDPLERFKWVMTFCVSALHATCDQEGKPFNPILGETFQAHFEDGTEVYLEQSSHHPPVTNWHVVGSGYQFYGYGEWTAAMKTNSILGHQLGPNFVEFDDGTIIIFNLPCALVKGVLMGDRVIEYEGTVHFVDKKNNLRCDLDFNPKIDAANGGGWFGWGKGKPTWPTDYVRGNIVHENDNTKNEEKKSLSSVEGTWMGCIEFDGESYWDFRDKKLKVHKAIEESDPLQSDSRFRMDAASLKKGDVDAAQEWKDKLENKQRKEKLWRDEGEKDREDSKAKEKKKRRGKLRKSTNRSLTDDEMDVVVEMEINPRGGKKAKEKLENSKAMRLRKSGEEGRKKSNEPSPSRDKSKRKSNQV